MARRPVPHQPLEFVVELDRERDQYLGEQGRQRQAVSTGAQVSDAAEARHAARTLHAGALHAAGARHAARARHRGAAWRCLLR
jgi:hypothetical protein